MKEKDPDKVLKKTVEKTVEVVGDYVEPGPRGAEETVEKVIATVDDKEVKDALEGYDKREEATRRAMNSQHPERESPNSDQDTKISRSLKEN
jgi:hypothetical protein